MPEPITSQHNPLLKEVRAAASRGGLTESGECVAEGWHLLSEALGGGAPVSRVLVAESAFGKLPPRAGREERIVIADAAFAKMASTETTQGVITLVRWAPAAPPPDLGPSAAVLVLDGVQDPGNVGTMVRSAEAFGVSSILSLQGTARLYHPKTLRASAGSVFRLRLAEGLSEQAVLDRLRHWGCPLLAATPETGVPCWQADLIRPFALAVGSEGRGLRPALAAAAEPVHIPTQRVESLNAAASAAILLYEAARQRAGIP